VLQHLQSRVLALELVPAWLEILESQVALGTMVVVFLMRLGWAIP